MMKLKGHTIIELKDVKTGKVERVEKDNLVTNAVQEFLSLWQPILGWGAISKYYAPLYKNFFGGLYIFDTAQVESASNTFLPNAATAKLVGYAGRAATDGNDMKRGSFNFNESEELSNGYKFVWDFGTSEANGTIASLSLTHHIAGFHGYHYDPTCVFGGGTIYGGNTDGNYKGLGWSSSGTSEPFDFVSSPGFGLGIPSSDDRYCRQICDFSVTPAEIKWKSLYSNGDTTRVWNGKIKTNNLNVLDNYGMRETAWSEVQNSGAPNERSIVFDTGSEIISLAPNYGGYGISVAVFDRTSYALTDSYTLNVYDTIGKYVLPGPWQSSSPFGAGMAYRGGYIYFIVCDNTGVYNRGYVAKFNISTKAVTLVTPQYTLTQTTNVWKALVHKDVNGNIYAGGYLIDNNDAYIPIDMVRNDITYGAYSWANSYAVMYTGYGTTGIRPNLQYLATINNLATPVIKTSSKVMKITYTLTEAT